MSAENINYGDHHMICVGVNPAFDVTLKLASLRCGEVSRVYEERSRAAGKALNVSAALRRLGADAEYIFLLGEENSTKYIRELDALGIPYKAVFCEGSTRENLTLLVDGCAKEYKINRDGFFASPENIERIGEYIAESAGENTEKKLIAVFSGSIPKGMTADQYFGLMMSAKSMGMSVAVDTEALSREQTEELSPWLYKPNDTELKRLFGMGKDEDAAPEELARLAMELCLNGVENVLLTLGEKGLCFVDKEGAPFDAALFFEASEKRLTNTTGAGDRALAGFIAACCMGIDKYESARLAAKCGEDEEEKLTADHFSGSLPM